MSNGLGDNHEQKAMARGVESGSLTMWKQIFSCVNICHPPPASVLAERSQVTSGS